jgi:membrane protease YdiL (CAAX protease family)
MANFLFQPGPELFDSTAFPHGDEAPTAPLFYTNSGDSCKLGKVRGVNGQSIARPHGGELHYFYPAVMLARIIDPINLGLTEKLPVGWTSESVREFKDGLGGPSYGRLTLRRRTKPLFMSELSPPGSPGALKAIFEHAQEESALHAAEHPELDRKTIAVLLTACVMLTLQNYVFRNGSFAQVPALLEWLGGNDMAYWIRVRISSVQDRQLAELLFWALVIKVVFRERIADYGLRLRGIFGSSWLYVAMFAFMAGPLVLASQTDAFQAKYPFYHLQCGEPFWPRLWVWELAYVVQFFALEFFFRGFMVHGLRPRFGIYAIFVMTVPYCMIHFSKPMAETFGAIGAGVVLGLMSLKTRSIWLGACLHVAVAMSMDFLSLWHKGMLG